MNNAARADLEDEESKDWPKEQIIGLQEVAGPELMRMIAKEHTPTLAAMTGRSKPSHVPLDRALGVADSELQQLAADPLCTPQAIVPCHPLDQGDGFSGDPRFPILPLGLVRPEKSKSFAVPTKDRLWLYDQHCAGPRLGATRKEDQAHPVAGGELHPGDLAIQQDNLLAQQLIFGRELFRGGEAIGQGAE
jgi:hypothetical protein